MNAIPKAKVEKLKIHSGLKGYLFSALAVLVIAFAGEMIAVVRPQTDTIIFYLLAVAITALRAGRGPAIAAAVMSVLALEFLVFSPKYSLEVQAAEDLLTLCVLLFVGIIISNLAARSRESAIEASQKESETRALYKLSRDLCAAPDLKGVWKTLQTSHGLKYVTEIHFFLDNEGVLQPFGMLEGHALSPNDFSAASFAFKTGHPSGSGTAHYTGCYFHYRPLKIAEKTFGVLAVRLVPFEGKSLEEIISTDSMLDSAAIQAAIAIERVRLSEETQKAVLLREKEKMQTVLLNSISHDLRTPLFSINGALAALLKNSTLDEKTKRELIQTAFEESERLNRVVGNLLDITRIEGGACQPSFKPCDIRDLIGAAIQQFSAERLGGRRIGIELASRLPEAQIDFTLMMRVLVNLVDNALKYSPPDTPITIRAVLEGSFIRIEVEDRGAGVPEKDISRIFEKFYRSEQVKKTSGVGLGLSICKGIVEAHAGQIYAERKESGTVFLIRLPVVCELRGISIEGE